MENKIKELLNLKIKEHDLLLEEYNTSFIDEQRLFEKADIELIAQIKLLRFILSENF